MICFPAQKRWPYLKFIPSHTQTNNCVMQQLTRKTSFLSFQRSSFLFAKPVKLLVWKTSWVLREETKWNQKLLILCLNTSPMRQKYNFISQKLIERLIVSGHHQKKYYLVLVLHKLMVSAMNRTLSKYSIHCIRR